MKHAHTWGSIFRNSLRRGDDHGYAAFLADEWERRQNKTSPGGVVPDAHEHASTVGGRDGRRAADSGSIPVGETSKMKKPNITELKLKIEKTRESIASLSRDLFEMLWYYDQCFPKKPKKKK